MKLPYQFTHCLTEWPHWALGVALIVALSAAVRAAPPATQPFAIHVIDEQTGRGVPLVELRTTSGVRFVTDSAGLAAIDEPSLIGRKVFFHVESHGYEFPKDGFGMRGKALDVKAAGVETIKIKRINIAERLYRLTGEGIYRDSVVLGRPVPIKQPLINAEVTGQDSNQPVIYQGKLWWFWGDTNRQRYPLGHFWMAGATSVLPGDGGLDPAVGVDLAYFVDKDGFSRGMTPREGNNPVWIDAVFTLPDETGRERLVCKAAVIKTLGEVLARRLMVFNDEKAIFELLKEIPMDAPLHPSGHPVRAKGDDGVEWVYFGDVCPNLRCRADWKSFTDLSTYEAFSCLVPGERYVKGKAKVERDADGRLVWGWKRNTSPLEYQQVAELVRAGIIKAQEVWFLPTDVETREPIVLGMGSIAYNPFRKRWVMIAGQVMGKPSFLGEIWYSEAARPEGPWHWARRIVTHDRYSFYNPVQHPWFAQDDGRTIYFEGTYTAMFSRQHELTPRYDYNQIMYRLDLADPRLAMPTEAPPKPARMPAIPMP